MTENKIRTISIDEETKAQLNAMEYRLVTLRNLLNSVYHAHLENTCDGAISEATYAKNYKEGAWFWLLNHYTDLSATVQAARVIADGLMDQMAVINPDIADTHENEGEDE
jgi:hypothetical protein